MGAPLRIGEGCSFNSFRTSTYKLHFLEAPSGLKVCGGGVAGVRWGEVGGSWWVGSGIGRGRDGMGEHPTRPRVSMPARPLALLHRCADAPRRCRSLC